MEAKEPQVKLDVQVIEEHVVLPVSQEECTALMVKKYSMAPSEREVVAEKRVKRAIEVHPVNLEQEVTKVNMAECANVKKLSVKKVTEAIQENPVWSVWTDFQVSLDDPVILANLVMTVPMVPPVLKENVVESVLMV